jgi:hypothetical protein
MFRRITVERVRENFWLGLGVFKQTKATGVAKCHLSVSLRKPKVVRLFLGISLSDLGNEHGAQDDGSGGFCTDSCIDG